MHDLPDDAALWLAARNVEEVSKLERYRRYRALFLSDEGGFVLDDILRMCRLHERTAVKSDPYETYFREGQRSIAISLLLTIFDEPAHEQPQRARSE